MVGLEIDLHLPSPPPVDTGLAIQNDPSVFPHTLDALLTLGQGLAIKGLRQKQTQRLSSARPDFSKFTAGISTWCPCFDYPVLSKLFCCVNRKEAKFVRAAF